jgi:hypothetical protein
VGVFGQNLVFILHSDFGLVGVFGRDHSLALMFDSTHLIQGLSGEMAQESKALEDKLGMLKDQLSDLRTSIKVQETKYLSFNFQHLNEGILLFFRLSKRSSTHG